MTIMLLFFIHSLSAQPIRQQILEGIYLEESQIMIPDTPIPGERLYKLMAHSLQEVQGYIFPPIPQDFDVPLKNVRIPYTGDLLSTIQLYANIFGYHAILDGQNVIFRKLEMGDSIVLFGKPKEVIETLMRFIPTVHFTTIPADNEIYNFSYPVTAPLDAAIYIACFNRAVVVTRTDNHARVAYGRKRTFRDDELAANIFLDQKQLAIPMLEYPACRNARRKLAAVGFLLIPFLLCLKSRKYRATLAIFLVLLSTGYLQWHQLLRLKAKVEMQEITYRMSSFRNAIAVGIVFEDGHQGVVAAMKTLDPILDAYSRAIKETEFTWIPNYLDTYLDRFKNELFDYDSPVKNHPIYQYMTGQVELRFLQYAREKYGKEWPDDTQRHASIL